MAAKDMSMSELANWAGMQERGLASQAARDPSFPRANDAGKFDARAAMEWVMANKARLPLASSMRGKTISMDEFADMAHVSRSWLETLERRDPEFPRSVGILHRRKQLMRSEALAWILARADELQKRDQLDANLREREEFRTISLTEFKRRSGASESLVGLRRRKDPTFPAVVKRVGHEVRIREVDADEWIAANAGDLPLRESLRGQTVDLRMIGEMTGWGATTVALRRKTDEEFPRSVGRIGKTAQFLRSDVDAYIAALPSVDQQLTGEALVSDDLVSIKEFAELTGLAEASLHVYRKQDEAFPEPAGKKGKSFRYRRQDALDYAETRRRRIEERARARSERAAESE